MIIYEIEKDECLPVCNLCNTTIKQTCLRDKQGKFWHVSCYETLLDIATESFELILGHTQDRNSAANSVAHRALKRIKNAN